MMRLRLQMLARLRQVQLEQADLVCRGRFGRALQVRGEPLAAADVDSLRVRVELARAHVLDHTLAQRADGIGTHGEILSEVDDSILRKRPTAMVANALLRDNWRRPKAD